MIHVSITYYKKSLKYSCVLTANSRTSWVTGLEYTCDPTSATYVLFEPTGSNFALSVIGNTCTSSSAIPTIGAGSCGCHDRASAFLFSRPGR